MSRFAGLALALLVACGGPEEAAPPAATSAPAVADDTVVLTAEAQRAAGVTTAAATEATRTDGLEAPAVIALDERRTARIGAVLDGIVVSTFAEVGARVRAGFVLAALDSELVHEAWAAHRKSVAEARRAENELSYARQVEARAQRLLRDQAVPGQDAERARVDRLAAEEQVGVARAEARRAEEILQHFGITSRDYPRGERGETIPVRSPIAGVVLERLVSGGGAVTTGAPLFVVSDLSTLWAVAEVDETAATRIAVGKPVTVRVASGDAVTGTIGFVGDRVNPKTRRITVRCDVPNPDGALKPDMFARVTLDTGGARRIVQVPDGAVQDLDGRAVVFVEVAPDRFTARPVRTGVEVDGHTEIVEGVAPGERIAASGTFLLKSELLRRRGGAAESPE